MLAVILYILLGHTVYTDIRYHRIYNQTVIVMIAMRLLWFIVMERNEPFRWVDVVSEGIMLLVLSVILIVVYAFSREGIGAGDVKLIIASSLYLGFDGTVEALILSTGVMVTIYSVQKRLWTEKVCFAPLWTVGLVLSDCVFGIMNCYNFL